MRGLAAAVGAAAFVAGCGSGGSSTPKGAPDPAATAAAQRYLDAYTQKDPRAICGLLAQPVVDQLGGRACAKNVRATLRGNTFPKLRVARSYADGAQATVTLKGSTRRIQLTREGGRWRVINGGT